jgi:hypothetical protein
MAFISNAAQSAAAEGPRLSFSINRGTIFSGQGLSKRPRIPRSPRPKTPSFRASVRTGRTRPTGRARTGGSAPAPVSKTRGGRGGATPSSFPPPAASPSFRSGIETVEKRFVIRYIGIVRHPRFNPKSGARRESAILEFFRVRALSCPFSPRRVAKPGLFARNPGRLFRAPPIFWPRFPLKLYTREVKRRT